MARTASIDRRGFFTLSSEQWTITVHPRPWFRRAPGPYGDVTSDLTEEGFERVRQECEAILGIPSPEPLVPAWRPPARSVIVQR